MLCLGYMIDTKFILILRNKYFKMLILSKIFFNFTQFLDESEVISVLEIIHIFKYYLCYFQWARSDTPYDFPQPCLSDLPVIT